MFGFNQGTLVVLLGLVALVFKLRIIAMMTIPKMFDSLCEKSPVAKEALQGSSKSLGTAIGAASYSVRALGKKIAPVTNMYLGPSYDGDQCIEACLLHREKPEWEVLASPHEKAAELLANGQLLAWFRGKMEFGPRALGNRSIFG